MIIFVCVGMVGCVPQSSSLYYWGGYERLIYTMYKQPGSADAVTQIQVLTADIQRAAGTGKPVAPGVYAHLGMMYASQGDVDKAVNALNMEKQLYPESTVMIDGMIGRVKKRITGAANE